MFQPNSIRSLLNKRQSSRIGTASTTSDNNNNNNKQQEMSYQSNKTNIKTISNKNVQKQSQKIIKNQKIKLRRQKSYEKQKLQQKNQEFAKSNSPFYSTQQNFNTKFKTFDPQFDVIIQSKLMIQQIDHQVQKIRLWREHQKQMTQQKLKSNQLLAKTSTQQYLKFLEKETEDEKYENEKMIKKMKEYQLEDEYVIETDPYQGKIYQIIAKGDQKIQAQKNKNLSTEKNVQNSMLLLTENEQKNEAFLNSINNLDNIFNFKKQKQKKDYEQNNKCLQKEDQCQPNYLNYSIVKNKSSISIISNEQKYKNKTISRDIIKAQLKQIDDQLKQIEDLLKDD